MKKGFIMVIFILLGIISISYGLYVRRAASGTNFYLTWIAMGLASIVLGLLIQFGFFEMLPSLVRYLLIGLFSIGIIMVIVISSLVLTKFDSKGEDNLDYIVVLGAQVKANGPSVALRYRLDRAVSYLEENKNTVCIVSGGQGYNEHISEAECMETYLVEHGIEKERIIKEDKSTNTCENFEYSMKVVNLKDKRVGVVTNNFHMYRALKIAKKCGIKNAYGIAAGSVKTYLPNNLFREVLAVVKDFVFGNI